jgi:DNA primase
MSVIYDQIIVSRVQQANDIIDVVGEHVSLKRQGREMVGLCPFHDDHRPSLYVNEVKQIFKCFVCGAGGDVLRFVQMRENLTFPQAVERLAERAGIKLKPATVVRGQAPQAQADIDPNKVAKVNAWAAKYFQDNLRDPGKGKYARDYIAGRGLNTESIQKWRLGLAIDSPDALFRAAAEQRIPAAMLEQAGLVMGGNHDKFVNRLMFTITDVTGKITAFGGRTLDETGAKYINSPATVLFDKSNTLFGLEQARHQIVQTDTAIVVEGYTDCIMAHQFGCNNVVATMGTSFTEGQGRALRRFAKKVVLLFDSDTAGIEAANRAIEICLSQRLDIKLAFVPQGKDPCDFLLAAGREPFDKLIEQATDVLQFKWDRLKGNIAADHTIAGMKSAIEEFLQAVAVGLSSGNLTPIERGLIVNRLVGIIGLDNRQINTDLDKRMKKLDSASMRSRQYSKTMAPDLGQGLSAAAQREVLEVLLNKPQLFEVAAKRITVDDFDVPVLRQAAGVLFDILSKGKSLSPNEVLSKTDSLEVGSCVAELAMVGDEKGNFDSRLCDALDVLERCRVKAISNSAKQRTDHLKVIDSRERSPVRNPHSLGLT